MLCSVFFGLQKYFPAVFKLNVIIENNLISYISVKMFQHFNFLKSYKANLIA